jgi:tRNA(Arg) A34 adenosine deaminase TadA
MNSVVHSLCANTLLDCCYYHTASTGLFHKGEQAVDEAAASAEQGKEEAKGVFGNLFHKGEQAVDDVKAEADRRANEGKRAGRHAANEAARSAEQGKEEAKGVFGGTQCSYCTLLTCADEATLIVIVSVCYLLAVYAL